MSKLQKELKIYFAINSDIERMEVFSSLGMILPGKYALSLKSGLFMTQICYRQFILIHLTTS